MILKQNRFDETIWLSAAVGSMNAPGGGGVLRGMEGMMRGMGMMRPSTGPRGPPQQGQPSRPGQQRPASPQRPDMDGPDGLDDIIKTMNLEPDKLPDLDNIRH